MGLLDIPKSKDLEIRNTIYDHILRLKQAIIDEDFGLIIIILMKFSLCYMFISTNLS